MVIKFIDESVKKKIIKIKKSIIIKIKTWIIK